MQSGEKHLTEAKKSDNLIYFGLHLKVLKISRCNLHVSKCIADLLTCRRYLVMSLSFQQIANSQKLITKYKFQFLSILKT